MVITIDALHDRAKTKLEELGLDGVYSRRLDFEVDEIKKQAADTYWTNLASRNARFDSNPNKLVLPWLLGMVNDDPIATRDDPVVTTARYDKILRVIKEHGQLPSDIHQDPDKPDIDIDCLPEARDELKDYATSKYSADIDDDYGAVCSVSTWMTYLLRSAIIDVASATELCSRSEAIRLTRELPDEVDELKDNGRSACKGHVVDVETRQERDCGFVHDAAKCPQCGSSDTEGPTIGKLIEEHDALRVFSQQYPTVIAIAVRLVGRVKAMGKHAGAMIITDRPLYGNIPMALDSSTGHWKSLWSEGRSTQLSKFGYTKWDILGLKNLKYIYEASRMIEQNHGISFGEPSVRKVAGPGTQVEVPSMSGWDDHDPEDDRAGLYWTAEGKKVKISLNDPEALRLANERKTDAVFQFDTDLAKRILSNGVRHFQDLMIFNAMGHPGPMAMIPDYVERREDESESWKKIDDPRITEILGETFNTIVYQEQLQALWQNIAGFTAPEAQEARKAVAKKWRDKLKPIKEKWLTGAGKVIGDDVAEEWWGRMETFGRYAFNRSHSVSYCLVAYHCLWLKAHFPDEWASAVMSWCNQDKLVRYMNSSRAEKVQFMPMDIFGLTIRFQAIPERPRKDHLDVVDGYVVPGLISLKGVGPKMAEQYVAVGRREYDSMDQFIEVNGKQKVLFERLIKLGSFKELPDHANSRALWIYYQCKHGTGKDIQISDKESTTKLDIQNALLEKDGWNDETVQEERDRQIAEYRQLYPKRKKIPKKIENWLPKPEITYAAMCEMFPEDYTLRELLKFEEDFLGYHLHSPLDQFKRGENKTIEDAKKTGSLECMVTNAFHGRTQNNNPMCRLTVTDGIQSAVLILWSDNLAMTDKEMLKRGSGFRTVVEFDEKRNNFTIRSGFQLIGLERKDVS